MHIHVRDPSTGMPSMELLLIIVMSSSASGKESPALILNITTGPGGRFIPSEDDPKIAAPGTSLIFQKSAWNISPFCARKSAHSDCIDDVREAGRNQHAPNARAWQRSFARQG